MKRTCFIAALFFVVGKRQQLGGVGRKVGSAIRPMWEGSVENRRSD
ncbi:hypothetical protein [Hoylesella loescheii]|nr:hypothetical protein [Hoylesella loescheii]